MITLIIGSKRTGKSTLAKALAEHIIKNGKGAEVIEVGVDYTPYGELTIEKCKKKLQNKLDSIPIGHDIILVGYPDQQSIKLFDRFDRIITLNLTAGN